MPEDSASKKPATGDKTTASSSEATAVAEGKREFEARFELLRPGFKMAIKAQNGFLAGLVFAEAKQARDAGNFAAARDLLGELEDLIKQAQKREEEQLRKAEKKFKEDYKVCERKARFEGGAILQASLGHLRTASKLAAEKNFIKANQQLDQVKAILHRGTNPPPKPAISSKSKPFTISGIPGNFPPDEA
ncbi:MAG: hypothetical protein JWQ71_1859 [Pedosphaera sp.]|nr:hypothetical protein [Pedosphaera sp.]